jgi:hypothetical protein
LEQILDNVNGGAIDSEMQTGSREPSPSAGEGRRLGDSSHNGLSSAFTAADQAHLVGDGGSATTQRRRQSPEAIRGGGSLLKSIETISDDPIMFDGPPDYQEVPGDDEMRLETDDGGVFFGPAVPDTDWSESSNPWDGIGMAKAGPSKMMSGPPGSATSDNGDAEMGGDGSSTKVEGGDVSSNSPRSFTNQRLHFSDAEDFMDTNEVHYVRGVRESAPPPGLDDDEDDLPVVEIPKPSEDDSEVEG